MVDFVRIVLAFGGSGDYCVACALAYIPAVYDIRHSFYWRVHIAYRHYHVAGQTTRMAPQIRLIMRAISHSLTRTDAQGL